MKKEKELKKDTTKVSDDKKKERLEKADSAFKRIASESKGIVVLFCVNNNNNCSNIKMSNLS